MVATETGILQKQESYTYVIIKRSLVDWISTR